MRLIILAMVSTLITACVSYPPSTEGRIVSTLSTPVAASSIQDGGLGILGASAKTLSQVVRFFGEPPMSVQIKADSTLHGFGFGSGPDERFRPVPVAIGYPLIEPRGLVKGRGFLYISDSGRDENHNETATIWRLEPYQKKLEVFYRGPLLKSSKWLWYVFGTEGKSDEIIVSDFGEELGFHQQGTGSGAKVFSIQVKPDGSAGETRILHEGAPLKNPQGVTVIGNSVIVSDTRAGEITSRKDAPDVKFRNGALFSIPLAGGKPTRLFGEQTFVTLVGSCVYEEDGQQYIRIWDIDGGRRDTSKFAWMDHSGFIALKRTKVESVEPLRLGPLEDIPLLEEFSVSVLLDKANRAERISVKGVNGTILSEGLDQLTHAGGSILDNRLKFIAASPISESKVRIEITYTRASDNRTTTQTMEFDKDDSSEISPFRDNKHGGAAAVPGEQRLDISVDGIARTVTMFPPAGGISVNLWQGAPIGTPMASHFSWDGKVIWLSDLNGGPNGTGAIWQIPVPSNQELTAMYTNKKAWMLRESKQIKQ